MLLNRAGVQYENVALTPDTLKELKESGKLEYGQVPALELDDGTTLCQSHAIVLYLAKQHGFVPETAEGEFAANNLHCYLNDDFWYKYMATWLPGHLTEEEKLA